MRIVFDYQTFALQSFGGISRYFVQLAKELSRLGEDPHVFAPFYRNQYLNELAAERIHGWKFNRFPPKSSRLIGDANRILCSKWIKQFKPDLVHETYYPSTSVVGGKCRIITIYDMIHEKFATEFPPDDATTARKRAAVARADHVISISHSTKKDLCEIFDVPSEKVSVVHLGCDRPPSDLTSTHNDQGPRPYLLYVGNRRGYKNFARTLHAVASRSRLREFDIVAFGGGPFSDSEMELILSLKFRTDGIRQVGGGDDTLQKLYQSASAFIYPSLYEGFGLPPLEAMVNGCPVISSNTSSMPEVIGDAGEYFDPSHVDDQADAIERVVFDITRRSSLTERGKLRSNDFTWMKCAQKTRDVYREVLARKQAN